MISQTIIYDNYFICIAHMSHVSGTNILCIICTTYMLACVAYAQTNPGTVMAGIRLTSGITGKTLQMIGTLLEIVGNQ